MLAKMLVAAAQQGPGRPADQADLRVSGDPRVPRGRRQAGRGVPHRRRGDRAGRGARVAARDRAARGPPVRPRLPGPPVRRPDPGGRPAPLPGLRRPARDRPAGLGRQPARSSSSCSSSSGPANGRRPAAWPSRSIASRATSWPSSRSGSSPTTTPGGPASRARAPTADRLYRRLEEWQIRPWIARDPWDTTQQTKAEMRRVHHAPNAGVDPHRLPVPAPLDRSAAAIARPRRRDPAVPRQAVRRSEPARRRRPTPATIRAAPPRRRRRRRSPSRPRPASTAAEPIERQPYRIVFHFACHPSSRIDAARRAELLRDWQVMVRRFVGTPWIVSIAPPSNPVLELDLQGLEKATPAQAAAFEKAVNAGVVRQGLGRPCGPARVRARRRLHRAASTTRRPDGSARSSGGRCEVLADAPRALLRIHARPLQPDGPDQRRGGGRGPADRPGLEHRAGQPDRPGRSSRARSSSPCGSSRPRTARIVVQDHPLDVSPGRVGGRAGRALRHRLGPERPADQADASSPIRWPRSGSSRATARCALRFVTSRTRPRARATR